MAFDTAIQPAGVRVAGNADIIRNILRDLTDDKPSLSRCVRTSITFFYLAGPLLYHKLVIQGNRPIRPFLSMNRQKRVDEASTGPRGKKLTARPRLKQALLQYSKIVKLSLHQKCQRRSIEFGLKCISRPTLHILFALRNSQGAVHYDICRHRKPCRILTAITPGKIVILNLACRQWTSISNGRQEQAPALLDVFTRCEVVTVLLSVWYLGVEDEQGHLKGATWLIPWIKQVPRLRLLLTSNSSLESSHRARIRRQFFFAMNQLIQKTSADIELYLLTFDYTIPENDLSTTKPHVRDFNLPNEYRNSPDTVARPASSNRRITVSNLAAYLDQGVTDELNETGIRRLEEMLELKRADEASSARDRPASEQ